MLINVNMLITKYFLIFDYVIQNPTSKVDDLFPKLSAVGA